MSFFIMDGITFFFYLMKDELEWQVWLNLIISGQAINAHNDYNKPEGHPTTVLFIVIETRKEKSHADLLYFVFFIIRVRYRSEQNILKKVVV